MKDNAALIVELEEAIDGLNPETDAERIAGLKEQVQALQDEMALDQIKTNGIDHIDEIPFQRDPVIEKALESIGMATVHIPDSEPETDTVSELVDQMDRRPAAEIYDLVDEYLAETKTNAPLSALEKALQECKEAHLQYDQFTAEHQELLDLQSTLSFKRTKLKRIMYGLLARHAQRNVKIHITKQVELGTLWELAIEGEDLLPDEAGYQIDYSIEPTPNRKKIAVINDQEFIEWCLSPMGNRDLLVIDAEKAKDHVMNIRAKAVKERKSEKVPTSPPPAKIIARIKPTVGKIKYDDLTTEETFKIEFERQGDTEPLFKVVSSHQSKPIVSGLLYPEAQAELAKLTPKVESETK